MSLSNYFVCSLAYFLLICALSPCLFIYLLSSTLLSFSSRNFISISICISLNISSSIPNFTSKYICSSIYLFISIPLSIYLSLSILYSLFIYLSVSLVVSISFSLPFPFTSPTISGNFFFNTSFFPLHIPLPNAHKPHRLPAVSHDLFAKICCWMSL